MLQVLKVLFFDMGSGGILEQLSAIIIFLLLTLEASVRTLRLSVTVRPHPSRHSPSSKIQGSGL